MHKIQYIPHLFLIALFMLLTACGGGSGSDGGTTPVIIGANLTISITDNQSQAASDYPAATPLTITVTAKNDFGRRVEGIVISFSSSLATLSQTSAVTNSNGDATVTLTSSTSDVGVATIIATGTVDGKSLTVNRNISLTAVTPVNRNLSLQILDNNCAAITNTVVAGSTLCLRATLTTANQPVSNEIISFSAAKGTLRAATALTNSSGVATLLLDTAIADIGAATASVSFDTLTASQNFAVTAPTTTGGATLSLVVLDTNCSTSQIRVAAGGSLCLQASLIENNQPVADALITFSASVGNLSQTSALTNSAGVASVLINSTATTIGAGVATISYNTNSVSQNYEFTSGTPQSTPTVSLQTLDASCNNPVSSVTSGQSICLHATLLNASGQPQAGQIMTFNSTIGTLRQTSGLTNNQGIATAMIDSTASVVGAGVVTSSFGAFSDTQNIAFTDGTTQSQTTLTLSILDSSCTTTANTAVAGTSLCLQASLIKDNQPQINAIINFSSTLGTVRQTSGLTNSAGVVSIFLDSTSDLLGAGIATAQFDTFTTSQNFQYTAPQTNSGTTLSLVVLDASCSVSQNRVAAGDSLCLQASLIENNLPIANALISFNADIGSLNQASTLTNSAGVATVLINSSPGTIGAGVATISYNTNTVSQNYEFTSGTPQSTPTVSLQTLDGNCSDVITSVTSGQSICLQATLLNANGQPQASQIIDFTSTIGTLRQSSGLTNSQGVATALIDSTASVVGAGVVTSSFGAFRDTKNIAFTDGTTQSQTTLTLSILDSSCTTTANTASAGTSLCLQASLIKDNQPQINAIINFSSTLGTVRQTTGLTNAAGVVSIFLDSTSDLLGAGIATAQFDTLTSTQNFQFTAPQSSGPTLSLVVLDASCGTSQIRVASGGSLCLQASVIDNNQPVADALVTFGVNLGALSQTSTLTNSAGVATVLINSSVTTIGAGIATLSYLTNSVSQNYEFTSGTPQNTLTVSLQTLDGSCLNPVTSVTSGASICLQATLFNASGQPQVDQIIDFTSTIGTLRQTSGLTNSQGIATVLIDSTTSVVGAGVVTSSFGAFSDAKNIAFNDGTTQSQTTLTLSILDSSCTTTANTAVAGTSLCLQASLIKDNQPQINAIINFSSTLGTVRQTTGLTNSAGVVSIFLDSTSNLLGAGIATAQFGAFTTSQNFQFTAPQSSGPTLSLVVLDANCSTSQTRVAAGGSFCLQASVIDNNQPVVDALVTFGATVGSLSQTSTLTNSAGVATVLINSSSVTVGAGIATLSYLTSSVSQNYEFTSGAPQNTPTISLQTLNSGCSSPVTSVLSGSTICLLVTLLDADNQPQANQIIDFNTTIGTLRQTSGLTNDEGITVVLLDSTSSDVGAGVVTSSFGAFSDAKNIAFTDGSTQSQTTLTLSILDSNCAAMVNTTIAGNSLCLQASLIKDNQPQINTIINFSSSLGTVRQTTGLTNSAGVVSIFLDSTSDLLGAGFATAQFGAFTTSQNFQFTAPQSSGPTLSLVVLDANCSTSQNRVAAGGSLCLQASVIDNNQPVVDALVSFVAPVGSLSQTSTLTNSAGVATVFINSTATTLGASNATLSYLTNTVGKNYEFTNGTPQNALTVSLQTLDGNCSNPVSSVTSGQSICLQGVLRDANDQPQAEQIINFTSTIGTLRQTSGLTNSQGVATALIDSTTSVVGAGVVTNSFGTVSDAKNIAFTDGTTQSQTTLTLSILDSSCTTTANTAVAGESLCLQASLIKDNQPQINAIINFSSTLGTVRQTSGLTNSAGVVSIFLDSTSDLLGAGIATAQFDTFTTSQNFQFTSSQSSGPDKLTLTVLDGGCANATQSFEAGETVCLRALLNEGNNPVPGEIITFAAPLGTLRQQTALTNNAGIASVLLDSTSTLLGAAAANASFASLSDSVNYEFVSANTQSIPDPQISLFSTQDGQQKNRFKVGESIQLAATLTDGNNVAINNAIIRFTVERGALATNSALTDATGKAQVTLSATDPTDIGAAVATVQTTINNVNYTRTFNYEVLASDAVNLGSVRVGYFNGQGVFIDNVIGTTLTENAQGVVELSAGGTMGLKLVILDENNLRITTPTPVTFTSACATNGNVNLDGQVSTINGEASSTYEDVSCATVNGNQDTIVATITVNSVAISASRQINILPEGVGSIEFISAEPTSIVLQGTGGQGKQESSVLTFLIKGVLGNPLSQQAVTFELDTLVGGLSVSPIQGLTNSQGLVTTRVSSGSAPAAVRVTATTTVADANGNPIRTIRTQSDLLSVNTGLPDQNSITLAAAVSNPESATLTGREVLISVYMADSFNNPVPNGTTVNFTTEGGTIDGSCNTTNGNCSVTWRSTNPVPTNHRATILATAIGHETFFDLNGNNVFDDDDAVTLTAITDNTDSGFGRSNYFAGGFIDHAEAWRDDNENNVFDGSDQPIDFNGDNIHDVADGLFNGPNCLHASLCGQGPTGNKINVRKAIVLIMSSNNPMYTLMATNLTATTNTHLDYIANRHVIASNDSENQVNLDGFVTLDGNGIRSNNEGILIIEEGFSVSLALALADDALGLGQTLPVGTTIAVSTSFGTVDGNNSITIPSTIGYFNGTGVDQYGGTVQTFSLTNTNSPTTGGDSTREGSMLVNLSFPDSNTTTAFSVPFRMIGR